MVRSNATTASTMASMSINLPGRAAANLARYSGTDLMRASIVSTFTGASVSRIDIEPVAIDALAWASSVGLRPSQPTGHCRHTRSR